MIAEVLPQYEKAFERRDENLTRTLLDSIVINDHEVAWMEEVSIFEGGSRFSSRRTVCEHDFTEGHGWTVGDYGPATLVGQKSCLYKETAIHLRQLQVRRELTAILREQNGNSILGSRLTLNMPTAIEMLIAKANDGEWLSYEDWPSHYSAYFSIHTLAGILDTSLGMLWEPLAQMWKKRKLSLDGFAVRPYDKPFKMPWSTWVKVEFEGWKGSAKLPSEGAAANAWYFDVRDPNGKKAYQFSPDLLLKDSAAYGPSSSDIALAEAHLKKLIAMIREHHLNPPEPSGNSY